jgi:flagellar M-ring protein FliF
MELATGRAERAGRAFADRRTGSRPTNVMMRLRAMWANATAFLAGLSAGRRLAVLGVALTTLALVAAVAWRVQAPVYRPLFTNLDADDTAAIRERLAAEGVPYRTEDGGRALLVPADRLYGLRLSLASRGLPAGGGVGFELFDHQAPGQTDFMQRLSYQRALQGELARTITELGGVDSARVHLALADHPGGTADHRASASVVVKLARGARLAPAQIDGIVHLVAASVEGLLPDAVTVVDESGRVLTAAPRSDESLGIESAAVGYQRAIERSAEERIESLLAPVVGAGKVVARVAATIDFARTERTEETYDPDKTVVRESSVTRDTGASASPRVDASASPRFDRRDEKQSFDVSKTVSRTVAPVGTVKALSVAVLIDGSYRDEDGRRVFVPRSDDEIERLKALVGSAVGVSDARGDRLEVTSAPFQSPEPEPAQGFLAATPSWAPPLAARLVAVLFALGALALVVRPVVRALGTAQSGPEIRLGERAGAAGELTRENVTLAQQNPERAAQLVREWLAENAKAG